MTYNENLIRNLIGVFCTIHFCIFSVYVVFLYFNIFLQQFFNCWRFYVINHLYISVQTNLCTKWLIFFIIMLFLFFFFLCYSFLNSIFCDTIFIWNFLWHNFYMKFFLTQFLYKIFSHTIFISNFFWHNFYIKFFLTQFYNSAT